MEQAIAKWPPLVGCSRELHGFSPERGCCLDQLLMQGCHDLGAKEADRSECENWWLNLAVYNIGIVLVAILAALEQPKQVSDYI